MTTIKPIIEAEKRGMIKAYEDIAQAIKGDKKVPPCFKTSAEKRAYQAGVIATEVLIGERIYKAIKKETYGCNPYQE